MERINGYRNIRDFKRIDRKIADSVYAKAWYSDGKEEYLFKKVNTYLAYNEIFYSKFMSKINFPAVEIDLAVIGKNFGIISKDYNSNHLPFYSVEDILDEYWKEIERQITEEHRYDLISTLSYEHDYNLKRLPKVINWFLVRNNKSGQENIKKECLTQFIAQVIGGNIDLRAQNMEIGITEQAKFSPLYDFGGYGEIIIDSTMYPYQFQAEGIREDKRITPMRTLSHFLKYAPKREIETFREYLELAQEEIANVNNIILEIEEQTNWKMPKETEESIKRKLIRNIHEINNKTKTKHNKTKR